MKVINKSRVEVRVLSNNFENGIYIGCYFKEGQGQFRNDQILRELEYFKNYISNKLPNLEWLDEEDKNGKHLTIMYSNNKPEGDEIVLEDLPSSLEIYYNNKLNIFPYGDNFSVVIELDPADDHEEYLELNRRLKEKYNLKENYEYNPHITIGVFKPEMKDEVEQIINNIKIYTDNERSFNKVYYIVDSAND